MNSVCQLFIIDENISTTLCINNYLSFLEGSDREQEFQLMLYNSKGNAFRCDVFKLRDNEYECFKLNDSINTNFYNCKIGLAVLSSEFGNPHFYTYYSDEKSIAMIHPQMKVPPKQVNSAWQSVQTINTTSLEELRIYQANPQKQEAKVVYHLCDYENDMKVCELKELVVPAMSANYATFNNFDKLPNTLQLWSPQIIAGNGKALIMRRYKSGLWTMNHG